MSAIPEGRWLKLPKWAEGMYEEVEIEYLNGNK